MICTSYECYEINQDNTLSKLLQHENEVHTWATWDPQ